MTVVVAVAEEKDWRFGIFFSLLWTGAGGGGGGGCGKRLEICVFFF